MSVAVKNLLALASTVVYNKPLQLDMQNLVRRQTTILPKNKHKIMLAIRKRKP